MTSPSGSLATGGPAQDAGAAPADGVEPAGRGYEPMSIRGPALIVLGLAVFLLIGGVVASAISSGSDPAFTVRHVTLADGTTVALSPAASRLLSLIHI